YMRRSKYVGVPAEDVHGLLAVEPVEPYGQERPQAVAAEELHKPPEPRLAAEVRRDACGLLPAYAAYLREQLRMVFEHVEGLFPESVHDERGCCRAYALDGAAREVGVDGLRRTGQAAIGVLGPELAAVARVGHPFPEGVQLLARAGRGQSSDNGGYSAVHGV